MDEDTKTIRGRLILAMRRRNAPEEQIRAVSEFTQTSKPEEIRAIHAHYLSGKSPLEAINAAMAGEPFEEVDLPKSPKNSPGKIALSQAFTETEDDPFIHHDKVQDLMHASRDLSEEKLFERAKFVKEHGIVGAHRRLIQHPHKR